MRVILLRFCFILYANLQNTALILNYALGKKQLFLSLSVLCERRFRTTFSYFTWLAVGSCQTQNNGNKCINGNAFIAVFFVLLLQKFYSYPECFHFHHHHIRRKQNTLYSGSKCLVYLHAFQTNIN